MGEPTKTDLAHAEQLAWAREFVLSDGAVVERLVRVVGVYGRQRYVDEVSALSADLDGLFSPGELDLLVEGLRRGDELLHPAVVLNAGSRDARGPRRRGRRTVALAAQSIALHAGGLRKTAADRQVADAQARFTTEEDVRQQRHRLRHAVRVAKLDTEADRWRELLLAEDVRRAA